MVQSLLQFALDPRTWLRGGLIFFGGIVAFAEISQRFEKKGKPPVALAEDKDDLDED